MSKRPISTLKTVTENMFMLLNAICYATMFMLFTKENLLEA